MRRRQRLRRRTRTRELATARGRSTVRPSPQAGAGGKVGYPISLLTGRQGNGAPGPSAGEGRRPQGFEQAKDAADSGSPPAYFAYLGHGQSGRARLGLQEGGISGFAGFTEAMIISGALPAPEVECIGKGKARAPYEFGCKVSIATPVTQPKGGQFVLHAKALHGNPFDGHTLKPAVGDIEKNTGLEVRRIHVDRGYRGHNYPNRFRVFVTGQVKRTTAVIKREMKRRAAIEPVIGHLKAEHRMDRNYLKGQDGDRINSVLAAAGFNFHLLLRWLAILLHALFLVAIRSAHSSQKASIREAIGSSRPTCSHFVLMQVETLGEALAAGWRVHARCLGGTLEYTRSAAKCRRQAELNLETLAWTRGRNMRCPGCGSGLCVRGAVIAASISYSSRGRRSRSGRCSVSSFRRLPPLLLSQTV